MSLFPSHSRAGRREFDTAPSEQSISVALSSALLASGVEGGS
jgi:hypothetical protein